MSGRREASAPGLTRFEAEIPTDLAHAFNRLIRAYGLLKAGAVQAKVSIDEFVAALDEQANI